MASPVLSSASSRTWLANRNPTSNEEALIESGNFWRNTSTNEVFECSGDANRSFTWTRRSLATATASFTPAIIGSASAGSGSYSVQIGRYQIINEIAFVVVNLQWTNHIGTGNLRISGLPFQPYPFAVQTQLVNLQNVTLPLLSLNPLVRTNGQFLDVYTMVAGGIDVAVGMSQSGILRLTGSFFL